MHAVMLRIGFVTGAFGSTDNSRINGAYTTKNDVVISATIFPTLLLFCKILFAGSWLVSCICFAIVLDCFETLTYIQIFNTSETIPLLKTNMKYIVAGPRATGFPSLSTLTMMALKLLHSTPNRLYCWVSIGINNTL